jgi:hypothetical protein
VPLRRQWFIAFRDGEKRHEWRRYGPRWNETTCYVGRAVVLGCGYSGPRLAAVVVSFQRRKATKAVAAIFGEGTVCAVIEIDLIGPIGCARP